MSLNDIIDIVITRQPVVPTAEGFGYANFVSPLSTFTPRIKSYANITEVEADAQLGSDALDFAGRYFGQAVRPQRLYVTKKGGGDTYVQALTAAEEAGSTTDWYGVAIDSDSDADILAVAAWAETRVKIFGAKTADVSVYDPDDEYNILSVLKDLGYDRTFLFYHQDSATENVEGAPFGLQLPKNPGSSNWAYKRFSGVESSSINATQRTQILDRYGNCYTNRNNFNVFENGRMVSGEWIDVIQGIDWLHYRMQNNIWTALVSNEKIPYTDDGISIILNQIREALRTSQIRGIIASAPEFEITSPLASQVSSNDKGNRLLPDITFEATLSGAINKTQIRGRILI
jgi:hypothetical protein